MVEIQALLILGAIIATSNAIQTMTGFGSIVIALTLGSFWLPVAQLKIVLMVLALPLCAIPLARHTDQVDRELLQRRIAPLMGLGLVVGTVVAPFISASQLQLILGAMVLTLACRDLMSLAGIWPSKPVVALLPAWMLGAGVVQGILASGGPLLVRALATVHMDRSRFRTTLLAVWLVCNVIVLAVEAAQGHVTMPLLLVAACLSPSVLLGIFIGEKLHNKVSQRQFEFVVQAGLVVSGLALLLR